MIYNFKVFAKKNGPLFGTTWSTEANSLEEAWELMNRALKRLEINHKTTYIAELED